MFPCSVNCVAVPSYVSPFAITQANLHPSSVVRIRQSSPAVRVRKRCRARIAQFPRCAANNDDWDRLQSRAEDSLRNAGRFFQTSSGQVLLWGGLLWLILTGRIGWIFDSVLILLALLSVVPVVGILAFRWWLNRQLVQGVCPSCGAPVTGLRNQPFQCLSCGQVVQGEDMGSFSVNDPSSATIDIDAKNVD